jgi:hypothetical protein
MRGLPRRRYEAIQTSTACGCAWLGASCLSPSRRARAAGATLAADLLSVLPTGLKPSEASIEIHRNASCLRRRLGPSGKRRPRRVEFGKETTRALNGRVARPADSSYSCLYRSRDLRARSIGLAAAFPGQLPGNRSYFRRFTEQHGRGSTEKRASPFVKADVLSSLRARTYCSTCALTSLSRVIWPRDCWWHGRAIFNALEALFLVP